MKILQGEKINFFSKHKIKFLFINKNKHEIYLLNYIFRFQFHISFVLFVKIQFKKKTNISLIHQTIENTNFVLKSLLHFLVFCFFQQVS